MGTYTTEAKIEAILQLAVNESTDPTSTELAVWITEVEADADAMALSSYTLTDQVIDVIAKVGAPAKNTIAWLEQLSGQRYSNLKTSILIPPFTPIISIASLSRRTSGLTETAAWEALTEGPGASASWIILKKRTKSKQFLGFAIYFYQNEPSSGYGRVKMTYNYGWNLSTDIIGEWCTLKVALKALDSMVRATTPVGARDYTTVDLRVGLDLESRVKNIKERIIELEERYFPKKTLAIGFI